MQITEGLIERIARRVFNAMFPGALRQSNVVAGSGGGGNVQHAVEADHALTADTATNASNVPWSGVSSKPAEATRWPTWSEVTSKPNFASVATSGNYNDLNNKPSIPSVSCSVSGSTITITINGTSYSLTDTNTWRPLGTGDTDAAAGNHNHDGRYLKTDLVSIELNTDGSLSGYGGFIDFHFNGSQADYTSRIIEDASGRLNLNQAVFVNYNGNVGIGTTSPSYKLHVAGTIYSTGSITERSDIRCKNVETYQWSPTLDMIADAPIIRYSMKDDETRRMRVGSVAQYWEKMMPETVSKDNNGILSMAQGDICMVNVIALAREVRKLREEIKQIRDGRN